MDYKKQVKLLIGKIRAIGGTENKHTGFSIGNTAKIEKNGLYLTPIRNMAKMVMAGVIVYREVDAVEVARMVDGKVDYVLVDAEKKITSKFLPSGELANVERAVREVISRSSLWIYKGNDLAVEAIDSLLTYLTKDSLRGIGGKKIAILGAGNLGSKLALTLVEQGGNIFLTRRNMKKLKTIVRAINYIKSECTIAPVKAEKDNEAAARGADILIGATHGVPVITSKMVKSLAPNALIIEAGKGMFRKSALKIARERSIGVYRLDISAALEGLISRLFAMERTVKHAMGRRVFRGIPIISGGVMGYEGEVVVDNINDPRIVYGVADGNGDFIRMLCGKYAGRLKAAREIVERYCTNVEVPIGNLDDTAAVSLADTLKEP